MPICGKDATGLDIIVPFYIDPNTKKLLTSLQGTGHLGCGKVYCNYRVSSLGFNEHSWIFGLCARCLSKAHLKNPDEIVTSCLPLPAGLVSFNTHIRKQMVSDPSITPGFSSPMLPQDDAALTTFRHETHMRMGHGPQLEGVPHVSSGTSLIGTRSARSLRSFRSPLDRST